MPTARIHTRVQHFFVSNLFRICTFHSDKSKVLEMSLLRKVFRARCGQILWKLWEKNKLIPQYTLRHTYNLC